MAAADPERHALERDLLALFARGVETPLPETEFDSLERRLFAYQFARNAPYRAYCERRGATPATVGHWQEIPAIPTAAFQAADLTTVPPEAVRVIFRTSGTTAGEARRGRCLLPDTRLYDASLLPNFQAHLLPDRARIRIHLLAPSSRHFPESSLGHMASLVQARWGAAGSGIFWRESGPCFGCLASALRRAERDNEPVLLLATSWAMVLFLEACEKEGLTFRLPPGSRIMDTGGFKGRVREVPQAELYARYQDLLGVPDSHIVNEYGMTEMASQFYDPVLRGGRRRKVGPPWVRTLVVDPETLAPVAEGEIGALRHYDLANLHTVMAIQTDDLGVWEGDGFQILGRIAGATPRGCSLATDLG